MTAIQRYTDYTYGESASFDFHSQSASAGSTNTFRRRPWSVASPTRRLVELLGRSTPLAADPETTRAALRLQYGRPIYRFAKRGFDVLFSVAVLVLFSWLFFVIALAIKIEDPKGPLLFRQVRVGQYRRQFSMLKFRSMCVDAEERLADLQSLNEKSGPVFKIAADPRITRVGRIIRKLSLDELPQFINVLRGDISLVGPRPALPAEVEAYSEADAQRLLVPQGLTCYWQTRLNRDAIDFADWMELDRLYVRKCGAWVDLKLIVQTVGIMVAAQGR